MAKTESDVTVLDSLSKAVRALAQPARIQLTLFPDFVSRTDELALEWEERYGLFVESEAHPIMPQESLQALRSLDDQLCEMSGSERLDLWRDEALINSIEWQRVRRLAQGVIRILGWSSDPPVFDDRTYVN